MPTIIPIVFTIAILTIPFLSFLSREKLISVRREIRPRRAPENRPRAAPYIGKPRSLFRLLCSKFRSLFCFLSYTLFNPSKFAMIFD